MQQYIWKIAYNLLICKFSKIGFWKMTRTSVSTFLHTISWLNFFHKVFSWFWVLSLSLKIVYFTQFIHFCFSDTIIITLVAFLKSCFQIVFIVLYPEYIKISQNSRKQKWAKHLDRHPTKEDIYISNKIMKGCLIN